MGAGGSDAESYISTKKVQSDKENNHHTEEKVGVCTSIKIIHKNVCVTFSCSPW